MQELSLGLVMQFFRAVTSATLPGIVAAPPYVVVHALADGSVIQLFKGVTSVFTEDNDPGSVVAALYVVVHELAVGSVRHDLTVDTSVVNVDMEPTFVGIEVEALKTLNELYTVHFPA